MKSLQNILTRIWIMLATVLIMAGAVVAIAALHVFKFFWSFLGRRKKTAAS